MRTVLIVNLGTPEAPTSDGIARFLGEFLADPMVVDYPRWLWRPILNGIILRKRPPRVAEMYASIWTEDGSPLAAGSKRIAAALGARMAESAHVELVYRYGTPGLAARLAELLGDEAARATGGEIVVVPLFPQRTASSSETVVDLVSEVVARQGAAAAAGRVSVARIAPDDPGYIEALAARFDQAVAAAGAAPEHLLVSFHGIPARVDRKEKGLYRADCEATAAALLAKLDWPPDRATLAYQSRFGPERWLEPATADVLESLPAKGVGSVAVIAPGFLTDGLETLEELGIRGRESFQGAGGGGYVLVPAVADHPALIASLGILADPSNKKA